MASSKLSDLVELAAQPATTDEFYINDGGISKRISYQNVLGAALKDLDDLGVVPSLDKLIFSTGAGAFAFKGGSAAVTALGILALAQSWTKPQRGTYLQLTDAATVAVDFALSNNYYVTVAGNRTIGAPSNKVDGQSGFLVVEQDGTGGRTTSFHADWDFGATGVPIPDVAANKKALFAYIVDWDLKVMTRFIEDF